MSALKYLPNLITIARIISVVPVAWLLWIGSYHTALILLVLAGLSDGLDGYLARRYQWFTPLGALLDPLADKLFIVTIMLVFGFKGFLPWWIVWLIFGRDVLIVAGAMLYRWVTGALEMRPLFISKVNTALQLILLAATLLHVGFYPLPQGVIDNLELLVATSTIISGAAYVFFWSYYAFANKKQV
ncbi:CDP-alcohol phosphatidyltransferase family protein [uncultured Thiothrix sp.]|uniref:CDP-alcohol phosphatidyltransferase family protein n=1 Tax=uncultured Thiothrix sp. TaxID=223185 RepID=UPI0026383BD7|nr:CDP-alcohol phosphatidyltransferase family protein [uncultured Thiothrix sp.]HMT94135.1 CDP-alcohol phosphatidyltransferase family protein [Thiolinea sp.]